MTQATIQASQITTENVQRRAPGKKGHIARECKEKKREKDSQWFKDKALLMEAKEKGAILDAEAEAFLADVECIASYAESLAITTTTAFEVSHEDAYDSDVDEAPHAAATFMANLTGTSTGEGTSNDTDFYLEVHTHNNHFFENMNHQVTQAMHQEEQLDSDVDSDIDDYDNIIPYHQYQSNTEVENVPTEGYMNTNKEQSLANDSLKAELERYKTQVQNLEQSKVKRDLEQLVTKRNKQNADLEEQIVSLKQQLSQQVESNKSLKTESEKLKTNNKAHEDSYQAELVWLRHANKVVTELLQSYGQPVQDNEDTLVHAEVSRTEMLEKMKDPECPIISSPINYAKLNNLYDTFVPQKELTREQAYWLPANEVASNQSKPAQQFVHTRPAKSQVNSHLKTLKSCFPEFDELKEQLQGKDNTIGKLKAHINNMKDVSTGPSLSTLEIENTKSKAGSNSSVSSGETILVKPKVVAFGLYAMTPKYVPPLKRINRETNSSLPRKETVTVVDLSNVPVNLPTGIKYVPDTSKSKSKSDKRVAKPPRNLNKNRVDSSLNDKRTSFISKSVSVCKTCNGCLVFGNHDECVVKSMNAKNPKVINNANVNQVWKATGKVFASVGSRWKPTGRKFTLGDTCPLTRINKPEVVSISNSGSVRTTEPTNNVIMTPSIIVFQVQVIQIVLWYLDPGCSRHMTGDRSKLINYVEKFIGTVRFRNDQFAAIVGYGDYKIGDIIITQVYYVEGLSHNLFQ
ncbi:hypothetical protein Tco_0236284 [Tanacetum coccineum]